MIKDTQEYLQHWEKENNPFYPSEMRWDRLQVNRFLKDYKKQLTISDVSNSLLELKKYSIDEIENYLDTIGYSIIKTTELDYLEEKLMNHTG